LRVGWSLIWIEALQVLLEMNREDETKMLEAWLWPREEASDLLAGTSEPADGGVSPASVTLRQPGSESFREGPREMSPEEEEKLLEAWLWPSDEASDEAGSADAETSEKPSADDVLTPAQAATTSGVEVDVRRPDATLPPNVSIRNVLRRCVGGLSQTLRTCRAWPAAAAWRWTCAGPTRRCSRCPPSRLPPGKRRR
jgi:hypothetical protein